MTRSAVLLKREPGGLLFSFSVLLVKIPCMGNCFVNFTFFCLLKEGSQAPNHSSDWHGRATNSFTTELITPNITNDTDLCTESEYLSGTACALCRADRKQALNAADGVPVRGKQIYVTERISPLVMGRLQSPPVFDAVEDWFKWNRDKA